MGAASDRSAQLAPGSAEARVLAAMRNARFAIIEAMYRQGIATGVARRAVYRARRGLTGQERS